MNRLPYELIDRVASYLLKEDLKNVLTLTSDFRYAAERYSGAYTEFTVTTSNSDLFLARFSGYRLSYLREVIFRTKFPKFVEPDEDTGCTYCRENERELQERDILFTSQIKFLFATLKSLEDEAAKEKAYGKYRLSIYSPVRNVDTNVSCLHLSFVSWRIHLLNPTELPQISSVRSFEVHNNHNNECNYPLCPEHGRYNYHDDCLGCLYGNEMKLDLRVILDLAARFPNLEFLGCQTGGYEWCPTMGDEEPTMHFEHDWEGPRRDARHNFASAVSCVQLPNTLQRASLDFLNPLDRAIDIHHRKALPDLTNAVQQDLFSSSLRIMSNNLRQLRIRAVVDKTLFGPNEDAAPFWPNLEVLEVMFHIARPDGKWYFQGPGGEGHDAIGFRITDTSYPPFETSELDEDMDTLLDESRYPSDIGGNNQFRITPHDTHLRPLLEGFAQAAIQMRALRKATIWTPLCWENDELDFNFEHLGGTEGLAWGITYYGPNVPPDNISSARQLGWTVSRWRPDPELHHLFQSIGRDKYGEELRELWTRDRSSYSPKYREEFEEFMFFYDPGQILLAR